MRHPAVTLGCLILAVLSHLSLPRAAAQITVNGANPNTAAQGTVNLDVIVSGSGFKKGAKAHWFVTGTTNPGGVTVNSTSFNNSGQLTANITVAGDAVISGFDIQVVNTDGRTGKGTELFAVKAPGSNKTSCPVPQPLNPPVASLACSSASGYTCLDATFGNAASVPPGGLVLTNTDGSIPGQSDIDAAATVKLQPQGDGTFRYVAIGSTTQTSGSSYLDGTAVLRYNLDGSLDTSFGTGGITKFFPPSNGSMTVNDGAIDSSGKIYALGNYQSGGSMFLLRFTPSGALDTSFNGNGYLTFTNFKVTAMTLQPDDKVIVAGLLFGSKSVVGGLVIRLNTNGSFDSTFGSNGQATIAGFDTLNAIALQAVGSQHYILAGGSSAATPQSFMVARLTQAGTLDSPFGSSGTAKATFCGSRSRIYSLSVDATGDILAFGWNNLANLVYAVARFAPNGAVDASFGDPATPGQAILDFYGGANNPTSIQPVLDSLGNQVGFIVGGYVSQPTGPFTSNNFWGLAKYHTDGSPDITFGSNGGFAIDFGSKDNMVLLPSSSNLMVQSDGRVVVVGTSKFASGTYAGYNFALARFWQ